MHSHDDGPFLQKEIDRAHKNKITFMLHGGTYRIASVVVLRGHVYFSGVTLHMQGHGAFTYSKAQPCSYSLKNLTIEGKGGSHVFGYEKSSVLEHLQKWIKIHRGK